MDKPKADMIQIIVVAIVIAATIIGITWAVVWRATERDKADARMQADIECYISNVDWVGQKYSFEVTCRLPQGE